MSQLALTKFIPELTDEGLLIIDHNLVKPPENSANLYSIPSTKIAAEDLEKVIVANMVMVGFTAKILNIFKPVHLFDSLKENIDPRFLDLNKKALQAGLDWAG